LRNFKYISMLKMVAPVIDNKYINWTKPYNYKPSIYRTYGSPHSRWIRYPLHQRGCLVNICVLFLRIVQECTKHMTSLMGDSGSGRPVYIVYIYKKCYNYKPSIYRTYGSPHSRWIRDPLHQRGCLVNIFVIFLNMYNSFRSTFFRRYYHD
jgi:hypothetical protein